MGYLNMKLVSVALIFITSIFVTICRVIIASVSSGFNASASSLARTGKATPSRARQENVRFWLLLIPLLLASIGAVLSDYGGSL